MKIQRFPRTLGDVIRREVCRVGFDQRNPKPETRNPKPTRIRLLGGSPDRNSTLGGQLAFQLFVCQSKCVKWSCTITRVMNHCAVCAMSHTKSFLQCLCKQIKTIPASTNYRQCLPQSRPLHIKDFSTWSQAQNRSNHIVALRDPFNVPTTF